MSEIPDASVQIIIADPPYNIKKDFGNDSDKRELSDYLDWCDSWIAQCLRILKPNGSLYVYGLSETLSFIRVRLSCNVRWLVWHMTNRVKPTLNFWQRSHESILHCWKDTVHFNRDLVREPYTDDFVNNVSGRIRPATIGRFNQSGSTTLFCAHPDGALPRDVIKVSALTGVHGKKERKCGRHPTQKPLALCLKLIKAVKQNETDLMVVPFAGSGSELVAAKMLRVPCVGFEINPEYIQIASDRLKDTRVGV
jgi:site-specific DNA-methyltransferase (adenine-specific)